MVRIIASDGMAPAGLFFAKRSWVGFPFALDRLDVCRAEIGVADVYPQARRSLYLGWMGAAC